MTTMVNQYLQDFIDAPKGLKKMVVAQLYNVLQLELPGCRFLTKLPKSNDNINNDGDQTKTDKRNDKKQRCNESQLSSSSGGCFSYHNLC